MASELIYFSIKKGAEQLEILLRAFHLASTQETNALALRVEEFVNL